MATSFESVYDFFLPKLTDYSFLNLLEEDLHENLETFLRSSLVKFRFCKKDLTKRDSVLKAFEEDLTEEEMEILASLMIVEYLSPKLITGDLLQQTLSSKDFKLYSQANHLKEIRELRDSMKKEANEQMINYTYSKSKMDEFK